jgi:hypothetical protein
VTAATGRMRQLTKPARHVLPARRTIHASSRLEPARSHHGLVCAQRFTGQVREGRCGPCVAKVGHAAGQFHQRYDDRGQPHSPFTSRPGQMIRNTFMFNLLRRRHGPASGTAVKDPAA